MCVGGYFGGKPYLNGVDLNGDGDTRDIRDCIQRPRLPLEGNAEIASARRGGAGGFDGNEQKRCQYIVLHKRRLSWNRGGGARGARQLSTHPEVDRHTGEAERQSPEEWLPTDAEEREHRHRRQ